MSRKPIQLTHKQCTACKQIKPLDEFCPTHRYKNGRLSRCLECRKLQKKQERELAKQRPREIPPSKTCKRCHQVKLADNFYRDPESRDGLNSYCRECSRELTRAQHARYLAESSRRAPLIEKHCPACGLVKSVSDFYVRRDKKSGYSSLCKKCHNAYIKQRDPRYKREMRLKSQYGISLDTYDDLLNQQGGACAICKKTPQDAFVLNVDHDHKTGKVRGLLCSQCNQALGLFEDNPVLLHAAVQYLLSVSS